VFSTVEPAIVLRLRGEVPSFSAFFSNRSPFVEKTPDATLTVRTLERVDERVAGILQVKNGLRKYLKVSVVNLQPGFLGATK